MRFDASLSTLFGDLPYLQRPAAAAAAGFRAVEMWWPFSRSVPPEPDLDRLVEACGDAGVNVVLLNMTDGDIPAGQHGLTALPEERAQFQDHLEIVLALASRLGCQAINALYGNMPPGIAPRVLEETAVENLALAASKARPLGISVLLEALNHVEFPRYGLHRQSESAELADRVLAEAGQTVRLLFDVYHTQRSEGDLLTKIDTYLDRIGHVQIADAPGRMRPGTGEIAFERVLPALEAAGYKGYVGLEYLPSADPADTFAWLSRDRARARAGLWLMRS